MREPGVREVVADQVERVIGYSGVPRVESHARHVQVVERRSRHVQQQRRDGHHRIPVPRAAAVHHRQVLQEVPVIGAAQRRQVEHAVSARPVIRPRHVGLDAVTATVDRDFIGIPHAHVQQTAIVVHGIRWTAQPDGEAGLDAATPPVVFKREPRALVV